MRPDGAVRPHWQVLDRALDAFGPGEMWRRWEQARQLIRQHGVTFNVYGDRARPRAPLAARSGAGACWRPTSSRRSRAGLAQRASLLDRLLADLYGPRRTHRRRAAAARGRFWPTRASCAPAPGSCRRAGASCTSTPPIWCARPTGRCACWPTAPRPRRARATRWRTGSSSGACCRRRSATANAQRLALFFRTLRETLAASRRTGATTRASCCLTAGPHNATYFEQAFLAQYLGYPLVEGGDLTVRDGRVFLKTLGGLHPVDVILRRLRRRLLRSAGAARRLAAGRAGPAAGCPGRQVAVANALGTRRGADAGADSRSCPALCRVLLGEELKLASVETWWCGQPDDPAARAGEPAARWSSSRPIRLRPDRARSSPRDLEPMRRARGAEAGTAIRANARSLRRPAPHAPVDGAGDRRGRAAAPAARAAHLRGRRRRDGYQAMPGALGLVGGVGRDGHLHRPRRAQQGHLGHQRRRGQRVLSAPTAGAADRAHPRRRRSAEPGGGQLLLAGALRRAGRGDRAPGAHHLPAARRSRAARVRGRLRRRWCRVARADQVASGSEPTASTARRGSARVPSRIVRGRCSTQRTPVRCWRPARAIDRVARSIRDRLSMDSWSVVATLAHELTDAERSGVDERLLVLAARLDRTIMTLTALSGFTLREHDPRGGLAVPGHGAPAGTGHQHRAVRRAKGWARADDDDLPLLEASSRRPTAP